MKYNIVLLLFPILAVLAGCSNNEESSDAYGNFEATETIVSARGNGELMAFKVQEGERLKPGQVLGYIDTTELHLKRKQVLALRSGVSAKNSNIESQINVFREKMKNLLVNKERIENLLADSAATQKDYDDINGQIRVLDQQIKSIQTQYAQVNSELNSLSAQLKEIDDKVRKSLITNPVAGCVLLKLAERGEVTAFGRPLYKIANTDTLNLRVYVSGNQLSGIRLGQEVQVLTDDGKGGLSQRSGTISWIASEAEFTPKTIQTREERVDLVYAVKITVPNDGSLKIGMPGEMRLMSTNAE